MKNNATRTLFLWSLLSVTVSVPAKDYYLATNGSDSNSGTDIDRPLATPAKAVSMLQPGDVCYIRGGDYFPEATIDITQTGMKDARIRLFAYSNEKPVFNFSKLANTPEDAAKNNRGIMHKTGANYWHYRGITFCNAPDNGMKLEGSFNVVENCVFHSNGDTGLQQGFGKDDKGNNTRNPNFYYGRYNIVLNCDSYDNIDIWSNGGDADGFAVKLFPGPGNEFHGCRSWINSDDGWDFYYTVFPIVVDNCWTMKNGRNKGNGNGFKMGGSNDKVNSYGGHVFTNCISIDNLNKGFDQNNHNEGTYMLNCVSVRNGVNYGFNMGSPTFGQWILRNCIGFGATERNHQFQTEKGTVKTVDSRNCSWTDIDGTSPYSDRDGNDPFDASVKYSKATKDHTSEFISLTYNDAIAGRQADGQLPPTFGRLKEGAVFIDKGVVIENLQTADSHKKEYELCGKKENYGINITIPHAGTSADIGAFEYGIPDNIYSLVMPENDGSVEDSTPQASEWEDEKGNYYTEKILVNWYPFQDDTLPDSISTIMTLANTSTDTGYDGNGEVEYSGTKGNLKMTKGSGYVEFTLPSLRTLQLRFYTTGTREVTIQSKPQNSYAWVTEKTESKNKGTFLFDVASITGKTKEPVIVRVTNSRTAGGDLRITDLYASCYQQIDEEGNPVIIHPTSQASSYDIYQTKSALIVYGNVTCLQIISMNGAIVASSQNTQVVSTSGLKKGIYAVIITGKDGQRQTNKFAISAMDGFN